MVATRINSDHFIVGRAVVYPSISEKLMSVLNSAMFLNRTFFFFEIHKINVKCGS